MPGIKGPSHLRINSRGLRGDEVQPHHDFLILTVGGSTTECLYLDQEETWPHLTQEALNLAQDRHDVWVGNAGKSGHSTREHLLQIPQLLEELPDTKLVCILVGANDLLLRLKQDTCYDAGYLDTPEARVAVLHRAFLVHPGWYGGGEIPFFQKLQLWKRIVPGFNRVLFASSEPEEEQQDEAGKWYLKRRRQRREAREMRTALPDLTASLGEWTRNLHRIIDMIRARDCRAVFLTQPTLWRRDLPEKLESLLWMGGIKGADHCTVPTVYYTPEALAEGMRVYNVRLLEVCQERGADLIDLAARLLASDSVFYDDMHFNENGARQVANIVVDFVLNRFFPGADGAAISSLE